MFRFVARRLLQVIPVFFVIITATFFMVRFVPGGPFTAEKAVSPEIMRNIEAHYGLDQPLWRQYLGYLGQIARGDLGPSFKYPNRTVNEIIGDKLPVSLELGGLSLGIALVIGLTLGVLAAVRRNTWLDYVASSTGLLGICVPTFVLGPILVLIFAIHFGWFNASGWYGPADRVLPSLTLGFVYAAYIMRLTRGGMLEVLNQDYIRTARAKGMSEFPPLFLMIYIGLLCVAAFLLLMVNWRFIGGESFWVSLSVRGIFAGVILWRFLKVISRQLGAHPSIILTHALRGGLLPVVAFLGPGIAGILTGSFVIETIFQIPGLGREFVNSAFNRDYTLVLGTVILYASLIVVCNLVVDVVQVWLNPRLKFE